jgi:hypothetical protein
MTGIVVMQVEVAEQYNDTFAQFRRTDGLEVTISKGGILAARVPGQDPQATPCPPLGSINHKID